ncbi:deoxyribose-phosphate aldolase [Ischnura elegans]|uniref:deoxyribose-phosphate aldolase n=1 Tax=Ischnura elegans TaxID=197161 RepID=UPI001ED87357|nr:deoxyribose-phosphate aldolase [Ischnura elegans]
MEDRNPGCELDLGWISQVRVNLPAVNRRASIIQSRRGVKNQWQAAWLLRAVTCIDLTTLSGDDTWVNVERLCRKAANPVSRDILDTIFSDSETKPPIHTAAVCVYPSRVHDAFRTLTSIGAQDKVNIASVATAFPTGQCPLKTRLEEIRFAVQNGANEIDIVLDRSLVLEHKWQELYQEIQQMKEACGEKAHMKTILAVGDLGSLDNVYKASLVAMMAGSDFIKTSTGKEGVNATLPVGVVMCRAIADYYQRMNYKVGFKPAGGIRTAKDSLNWLFLIKEELGNEWLNPHLFRIGASGLLTDIERQLFHYASKGRYAAAHEFTSS